MVTPAQRDELHMPKGSVIFRQGDPGHEMFVISAGRVRLTIGTEGHEKEVAVLGPGEFFGELSLLSEAPRSATATAVEDSVLLAIGRDVFAMMVQDDLDIVFRMMNIQGQRLSNTNQPIEDLTRRMGRVRVAAHCLQHLRTRDHEWELPATLALPQLVTQLNLSPQVVDATVSDLVQNGVGTLHGGEWRIEGREQVDRLIEALSRYAEGRAE